LITEICKEAARAQPFAFLRMSGLVLEILAEILRGTQETGEKYDEHVPMLEKGAEFIRKNSHRDLSVEQAAEICDLSPSYFRKLFAFHYQCSPKEYLIRTRIRKAKELMMSSSLNLTEISEKVGYATVHSFSKAFKLFEGISPSRYRSFGPSATRVEGRKRRT